MVQGPPTVLLDRSNHHVGFSVDVARRLVTDLDVRLGFVESC